MLSFLRAILGFVECVAALGFPGRERCSLCMDRATFLGRMILHIKHIFIRSILME